jgi:hypothetical protein
LILLFAVIVSAQLSNAAEGFSAPAQDRSLIDNTSLGDPLSGEDLSAQSGREAVSIDNLDMMLSNVDMNGNQRDNSISGNTSTGANSVTGNAFTGMNGFATVIQNSGNQVLIQNDLIVNISTH